MNRANLQKKPLRYHLFGVHIRHDGIFHFVLLLLSINVSPPIPHIF